MSRSAFAAKKKLISRALEHTLRVAERASRASTASTTTATTWSLIELLANEMYVLPVVIASTMYDTVPIDDDYARVARDDEIATSRCVVSIEDDCAEFTSYVVLLCNPAKTALGCTLPRLGDLKRYGRCDMFQLDFDCVNLTYLHQDFEAYLRTVDNYLHVESTRSEHKTTCVTTNAWLSCDHTRSMLDFITRIVRVSYSCC